tara:strand:- start:87 stop:314 length:228 start_codon:yes stop_codon:yes gene_type:complete
VDAIGRARIPYALLTLGELIAETDAPEDHTAIYAAFQEKAIELGVTNSEGFTQIIHSMAEQGEEAKEKEKEKEGA